MNKDLGFTAEMFGFGAGIFFAGYVLFEIPGALIAERFSAKRWLARIMVSWGLLNRLDGIRQHSLGILSAAVSVSRGRGEFVPVIYACVIPRWFNSRDAREPLRSYWPRATFQHHWCAARGWLVACPSSDSRDGKDCSLIEAVPAIILRFCPSRWMADSPESARLARA